MTGIAVRGVDVGQLGNGVLGGIHAVERRSSRGSGARVRVNTMVAACG